MRLRPCWRWIFLLGLWCGVLVTPAWGRFFEIGNVKQVLREPRGSPALVGSGDKFFPYLEVELMADAPLAGNTLFARAYYYNEKLELIATEKDPAKQLFQGVWHAFPAFVPEKKAPWKAAFRLPEAVQKTPRWRCVIVHGNDKTATAKLWPGEGAFHRYDFPERERSLASEDAVDMASIEIPSRVVEFVSRTNLSSYPQITFFLKRPAGMKSNEEARGVIAVCMLAHRVDDLRRRLELEEFKDDYMHIFQYAKEKKLLILAWGSRRAWDPRRNTWELPREEAQRQDREFEAIAKAWEKGVRDFGHRENFNPQGMLLWGYSASAQYAKRLALRRPGLFRAVYLHIPSSFDTPRPEAARVMWCVTTGERDHGYASSLEFYERFRKMGAPIYYKSVRGLGHNDSRHCHELARAFFDEALTHDTAQVLWRYEKPQAFGDALNQSVVAREWADWLPYGQQVSLPDERWIKAWAFDSKPALLPARPTAQELTPAVEAGQKNQPRTDSGWGRRITEDVR